ncbi:YdcF family protein [Sphingomonas parva]|uniref:YdcF family protein n=1 Tax=Sphingomonas parva TaxID=2555898 RepID=A0A4Y8ZPD6_9SPHN|nr:YdcF family protein [Sphingomonas parva]TFI56306.1 YdcF family protein [Sphingomonas parva]
MRIVDMAGEGSVGPADAAIVLGAAIDGNRPSAVFEARIAHGIALFRRGAVRRIVFTGGATGRGAAAESEVARAYALARGVPRQVILIETVSRTTHQNLVEARRIARKERIEAMLIVTDPLHMRRALRMASDLGLRAEGAPTPFSRYRSWSTKAPFLLRKTFFYNFYLLTGH